MASLDAIKDLVDVVSVPTYFLADPANQTLVNETGGLVPGGGADRITALLQASGYVEEKRPEGGTEPSQCARCAVCYE